MGKEKVNMNSLLKEKTGKTNVMSIDFKGVESATQKNIEFRKVRGSVRLMVNKIKTPQDVAKMVDKFLDLRLP
jgi:hypothetical protein